MTAWLAFAAGFLVFVFALLPGTFLLAVAAGRVIVGSTVPLCRTFTNFAFALVPLGLGAWIAFTLSFVFANLSYLWPVFSDPMGWGWNLFGTAAISWTPYLTRAVPFIQVGVLLGALAWSSFTARQIAQEARTERLATWQALPVTVYCFLITLVLLGLLVG